MSNFMSLSGPSWPPPPWQRSTLREFGIIPDKREERIGSKRNISWSLPDRWTPLLSPPPQLRYSDYSVPLAFKYKRNTYWATSYIPVRAEVSKPLGRIRRIRVHQFCTASSPPVGHCCTSSKSNRTSVSSTLLAVSAYLRAASSVELFRSSLATLTRTTD